MSDQTDENKAPTTLHDDLAGLNKVGLGTAVTVNQLAQQVRAADEAAARPSAPEAGEKPAFTLTKRQQEAHDKFLLWLKDNLETPNAFRVFGYAGTGKTTMTKQAVADACDELKISMDRVVYGAYTVKAASVMRKNNMPARSIHSTIYKVVLPSEQKLRDLHEKIKTTTDAAERKRLGTELTDNEKLRFKINDEDSPLLDAKLFVVDEVSMVNEEMKKDIEKFDVPVLVLGDPGQLPPIEGQGAYITAKPDVFLDEIMRQALDNPIIKWSILARGGARIPFQDLGQAKHIRQAQIKANEMIEADQILTGKNKTRQILNQRVRDIKGFSGPYPVPGDKLVCLKNDNLLGIYNGMICTFLRVVEEYDIFFRAEIETDEGQKMVLDIHRCHFDEYHRPGAVKETPWWDMKRAKEFDYGYALTVHKSQGSQYDNVVFWDDKFFIWDLPMRSKWLYTGVTRSANRLTIAS